MEFPKGGKHLEPPQWDRGPAFSSFESGYIAGAFSERELEEKERRNGWQGHKERYRQIERERERGKQIDN